MGRRRYDDDEPVTTTSALAIISLVLGILSFCTTAVTGIPAMLLGVFGLIAINRSEGRVVGKGLAVAGLITGLLGTAVGVAIVALGVIFGVPAYQDARARVDSDRNLHQIGLALHNYHDSHGEMVPPYSLTKDGRPGLSWRVHLLPYLEYDSLYRQFKLDEPWDSEHNKRLLTQMPKVYATPGAATTDPTMTHYQVFVGKGTAFEPGRRLRLTEIIDGTTNTVAVVEAAKPVPWTAPQDIPFGPESPPPELGVGKRDAMSVMCDASRRLIKKTTPPATIRGLATRDGGEVIFDY